MWRAEISLDEILQDWAPAIKLLLSKWFALKLILKLLY